MFIEPLDPKSRLPAGEQYLLNRLIAKFSPSGRRAMFREPRDPHVSPSARRAMFIEPRDPHVSPSGRRAMFIEPRDPQLSPSGRRAGPSVLPLYKHCPPAGGPDPPN